MTQKINSPNWCFAPEIRKEPRGSANVKLAMAAPIATFKIEGPKPQYQAARMTEAK